MITKHKYVRVEGLGFILWPMSDEIFHSHIGQVARCEMYEGNIVSAGFAYIGEGGVDCRGESESLGIKSRADDSMALAEQLGL